MTKCKLCGSEIAENQKWIKVPELKIEVEKEIHDKGECLKDIQIPKGCRLLKAGQITFLFNNKNYNKLLNLLDTWEFIEQPFELNKKKGYVARFGAGSDWANLICDGHPGSTNPSLGVRFVRENNIVILS